MDLVVLRILFVFFTVLASYELKPLGLDRSPAAGVGLLFGLAVVLFEIRLRKVSLKRLVKVCCDEGRAPEHLRSKLRQILF